MKSNPFLPLLIMGGMLFALVILVLAITARNSHASDGSFCWNGLTASGYSQGTECYDQCYLASLPAMRDRGYALSRCLVDRCGAHWVCE